MILIEFDNPGAFFFPGQQVSGKVTLTLKEKLKAHSLVIGALGQAHTHWTESRTKSSTDSHGRSTSETYTVTYSETLIYLQREAVPWSSTASCNKLDKGVHVFPFVFLLPPHCPPSFEGFYGYIRYEIFVQIDRVWKLNKNNRQFFSVAPHLDLNTIPQAIVPVASSAIAKTGIVLFRNGKIGMQARIPKGGFVPGECIPVEVLVDNASSRAITQGSLKLYQNTTYFASRSNNSAMYNPSAICMPSCHHESRQEKKCVISTMETLNIPPKSKQTVVMSILVPAVVATLNSCPFIIVEYSVTVAFHSNATLNNKMSTCNPIFIGTVPVQQNYITVVHSTPSAPTQQPFQINSNNPPPYALSDQSNANSNVPSPYPSVDVVQPSAPASDNFFPPPSYAESVFGSGGTTKDTSNSQAFVPVYPYYSNLQPESVSAKVKM